MRWHGVSIDCVNCNIPCLFVGAAFSADLEFAFNFKCSKCGENFNWRVYASALAHKALIDDMAFEKMKRIERKMKGLIDPPLAEPAIPATLALTEDDKAWERAMHISPNDDDRPEGESK
jgi:hypothetical protein